MIGLRAVTAAILCTMVGTSLLGAADFSSYRGFRFGSSVAAGARRAGTVPSAVKVVHRRPALIQELEWQPAFVYSSDSTKAESVREGLLRFYNGQLFQIVTTYDRQRVEGMTEANMVEALSKTYGTATKPTVNIAYRSNYGEIAPVIARWENAEYAYSLVRTGDQSSFALILSLKRLDALAQTAIVEAGRLDELEAPQRAIDLEKRQAAESRLTLDKARSANMPNFRP